MSFYSLLSFSGFAHNESKILFKNYESGRGTGDCFSAKVFPKPIIAQGSQIERKFSHPVALSALSRSGRQAPVPKIIDLDALSLANKQLREQADRLRDSSIFSPEARLQRQKTREQLALLDESFSRERSEMKLVKAGLKYNETIIFGLADQLSESARSVVKQVMADTREQIVHLEAKVGQWEVHLPDTSKLKNERPFMAEVLRAQLLFEPLNIAVGLAQRKKDVVIRIK